MTEHLPAFRGPVFATDSPFRNLPAGLDSRQRRFLEGIRFAVEMAHISTSRMRDTLSELTIHFDSSPLPEGVHAEVLLDAWSFADSVYRLRKLLNALPRLKKKDPMLQLFMRGTASIETLRNRVQHLSGDLNDRQLSHLPVWGTIGWLWVQDLEQQLFLSGVLIPGPDPGHLRPILSPGPRDYHDQLDHMTLTVGDDQLNVSEGMRLTVRLCRGLEKSLRPQFDGKDAMPGDFAMLLNIKMSQDQAPTPGVE